MRNKKFLAVTILTIVMLVCVLAVAACFGHVCADKCPICNKCTNEACQEEACKDKCLGHSPDELLDYDMSGVTFADKTVAYNGAAQTLEVAGTLPNGVTVEYEYYQGEVKLDTAPVNAGAYTVVAKFTGDSYHKAIEDKTATLTIDKANIEVILGASKNAFGEALSNNMVFTQNKDGSFGAYVADDASYTIEVLSSNVDVDFDFYGALNEDNAVDESTITSGELRMIGDVRYVLVTLANEEDAANYNDNLVILVKGEQRVVEIATYEDLLLMVSDIDTYSLGVRKQAIYKLVNDIDCEGRVWQTIGTRVPTGSNETQPYEEAFLGEFDGQGHKVYNFKLTDESVKEENINDKNGIALGFFGFISDADIHDVTFADITIDFSIARLADASKYGENAYTYAGSKPIYLGVVAGRVNIDDVYKIGSSFSNIKVENVNTVNLTVTRSYIGTFFGWDSGLTPEHYGTSVKATRENLTAQNINITAKQKLSMILPSHNDIYLGGFVGAMFTYMPLVYENCSVTDITLVCERDMSDLTDSENEYFCGVMGGFVAWHRNLEWTQTYGGETDGFKNCELKNYTIINKSNDTSDDNGIYCGWETSRSNAAFTDCAVENDADSDREYGFFKYKWNAETGKTEKFVYTGEPKWTHACSSVCPICGLCTDEDCLEEVCSDKCQKHGDEHICENQCPICHKCLNEDCQEDACKDKCPDNHTSEELLDYDYSNVSFEDKTVTYDGKFQTPVVVGSRPDGISIVYAYYKGEINEENKLDGAPVDAGVYKVVATFTGDRWHKVVQMTANLTINKATHDLSGVTFEDKTVTYDGNSHTIPLSGLPEGLNLGVDYDYYKGGVSDENKLDGAPVNAGVYTVVVKFIGGGVNYDVIEDMTATLTIEKAAYTVNGELKDKTVTYDGKSHEITLGEITLPEGIEVAYEYYNGTVADGNKLPQGTAPVNAGTYVVVAKFTVSDNYQSINDMTAALTIAKADVEITFGATKNADNAELGGTVVFRNNGQNTFVAYYAASGTFNSYQVAVLESSLDVNVEYYTALTNGTVDPSTKIENGTISSNIQALYALVTLADGLNPDNYNLPVLTINGILPTSSNKAVVEIETYEDLLLMASDAEILPAAIRENMIYKLMNDIDCGGNVWKTIGPISIGAGTQGTKAFVSELTGENANGKDYKIYNFQITNESVNKEVIPNKAEPSKNTHALAFGFFGYVSVAKVHNVTFDSITVNINQGTFWGDTESNAAWVGNSYIQFGVVAGYVGMSWVNEFHDITVSNLNANIIIVGGSVGTFFGVDEGRDPNLFKNNKTTTERTNLTASDISITAHKSYYILGGQTPGISLGGLVGELKTTGPVYYVNCSVSDVALMLSPYPQTTGADRIFEGILGGFVGKHDTVEWADWNKDITAGNVTYPAMASELLHDKFENCTISNYKLINCSNYANKDMTDIYCGYEASPSNSAKYRKEVQFIDCQATIDEGVTGCGINHYVFNAETGKTDIYVCSYVDGEKTWTFAKSI